MAQSREVEYVERFNGGLNLTDQTQALSENESPDCLNVDFGGRGGFVLRGGFQYQTTDSLLQDARFAGAGYIGTAQEVILQGTGNELLEFDGSTITDTGNVLSDDATERVRMATFAVPGSSANGQAYFTNCWASSVLKVRKWDGTTFTTMTNAFNDDYLSPSGLSGDMPLARHIASWGGFMWVADTVESGTRWPSRVRFSHAQAPEDWATDDWFNVGGNDNGDPVTSLVPFGDRLLVFKRSGVWQVFGYDRDTFVLEQITSASGTCTCGAIAVNSGVAYWFATDGRLMAFNGRGVADLTQPIQWWSDIGKIKHGGAHRLMWSDGRLWLSLEAGASEDQDRWLFIWDAVSKTFTRYSPEVTDLINWVKTGSDADPLFLFKTVYLTDGAGNRLTDGSGNYLIEDPCIWRYDREYFTDTTPDGTVRIDGYYRTGWLRAGETATKKRWKRPRVTAAAKADATIRVDAFYDFDDLTSKRTQEFTIDVGDASVWGTMNWGDTWYAAADEYYAFPRLGATGSARAISYKFSSADNASRWWVDSVAIPFRRKKVK